MEYNSFDQIDLPNLTVTEPNPSHSLAFRRFTSDQVGAFNRLQVDIIRQYSNAPITHNYMGRITDFDQFKVGADLDFASWDSYPLGFLEDRVGADSEHQRAFAKQGDPDFQAFHHDLYRAVVRGRWWVMEQQPGPVNWALYNPAQRPAWCVFGAGRLLRTALKRSATSVGDRPPWLRNRCILAYCGRTARRPQRCMKSGALGLTIDILSSDSQDFGAHQMVFAPGMMHMPEALKNAPEAASATAVIGPRSAARDEGMRIPVPLPPAIGSSDLAVSFVESLRPDCRIAMKDGGHVERYFERIEGEGDVMLQTEDGTPVALELGKVIYVAGTLDQTGWKRLIREVAQAKSVRVMDLPEGIRCRQSGAQKIWFNHTTGTEIVNELELPPFSVTFDQSV